MRIKTRLQITAVFFVSVVLAIGSTLFFLSQQVNEALEQNRAADEIAESAFELNILTGDYLLHQEERALSQWHLKYGSLSEHLMELEFQDPGKQTILDEVHQLHEDINVTFSQLVTSVESEDTNGEETELREMFAAQLSVQLQDMVSYASLLANAARGSLMTATQTSSLLVAVFVVATVAVVGANAVLIINSVAKPIAKLHEGVDEIAGGNLDHRVGTSARNEIGQLSRAFDQMSDDLKARTDDLKEYSEKLEETVEERTKELRDAQEDLVRKEKKAVLGELASGMAHELRNPLGVIKNSTYFLSKKLKDASDEKLKRHLKIIENEIVRSNRIITDLLDYAEGAPPVLGEADLNDIVANTLSASSIPRNIEVTTRLDEIPPMLLDQAQIRRAFQNVVLNAVYAMQSGGKLMIQTVKRGNSAKITVKDTGVGIPKGTLPKIFTPLFSTKAKGLGLGLPICKQIVEGHGGSITARSKAEEGTTFAIKLPIRAINQK